MRVLLTGSAGDVGSSLATTFRERYELRTFDRVADDRSPDHVVGDLADRDRLVEAMRDCEVVVHLAAQPREADFQEVLVPANIVGLHNTCEAAIAAGVRRLIFASTCQTVLAYPRAATVAIEDAVRPSTLYGASKAFGEIMGRWYHDQHGLEFAAVRIGWFMTDDDPRIERLRPDDDRSSWARLIWLSEQDAAAIFTGLIDLPELGYERLFATSRTEHEYLSLAAARRLLGYEPSRDVREFGAASTGE